jgi:hypothetical protein
MNTSLHLLSKMRLLLPVAILVVLPLRGDDNNGEDHRRGAKDSIFVVLYQGPRVGDPAWTIKSGPVGPDNQEFRDVGGTCSMIPSDVHNVPGSAFERVTFEAKRNHLNVWEMVNTHTAYGPTSDGNRYTYQNQFTYRGPTTDGKAPKPNRAMPSPGNPGFFQVVPSNVNAGALDMIDLFILQTPGGGVVANSHVRWTWRLQIPPAATDPPPAFFPFILDERYIVNLHDQLAGQLGCDPI